MMHVRLPVACGAIEGSVGYGSGINGSHGPSGRLFVVTVVMLGGALCIKPVLRRLPRRLRPVLLESERVPLAVISCEDSRQHISGM